MPTTTINYSLIKPSADDFYNVSDQNENMNIIDTELKKNADAHTTHKADDVAEFEVHGMRVTAGKFEYFDGVTWKQVGGGEAAEVVIVDPGNYYTSTNVNGALQEIGYTINGVNGVMVDKVNEALQM